MEIKIYEATSIEATKILIDKLVGYTLLNFYSPICGPCVMLEPVLEELVEKNKNVNLVKVNTQDNFDICKEYNVKVTPTTFIFENSKQIEMITGYKPIEEWEKLIKA